MTNIICERVCHSSQSYVLTAPMTQSLHCSIQSPNHQCSDCTVLFTQMNQQCGNHMVQCTHHTHHAVTILLHALTKLAVW